VITKWIPGDDELDAIARSLPAPNRDADRIEHERTNVLAQAAGLAQHKRGSRMPLVIGVVTTFAAAAAVLFWFVARPSEPSPKERITALGPAEYARTRAWPDFNVRLDSGRIAIQVWQLAPNERFRATTSDAEIEVRGAKLLVGAEQTRVTFVSVSEGRAEVRWAHQVIVVAAGSTWIPPRIAQRDVIEIPPRAPAPALPTAPTQIASPTGAKQITAVTPPTKRTPSKTKPTPRATDVAATTGAQPTESNATASREAQLDRQLPIAPRPGEADFRAGIAALRGGDATAATKAFAAACNAARDDALGEDACFWVGAAAKRAGDISTARDALTRFLTTFPSSSRTGEAAALLGWILYDAGELDAAKKRFEQASRDRVPKVKESALKGLEAIKRNQASQ
jgi:TolA-binding protein